MRRFSLGFFYLFYFLDDDGIFFILFLPGFLFCFHFLWSTMVHMVWDYLPTFLSFSFSISLFLFFFFSLSIFVSTPLLFDMGRPEMLDFRYLSKVLESLLH